MPFNVQETIKKALQVPIQQKVEGAAIQIGANIKDRVNSVAQAATGAVRGKIQEVKANFGFASKSVKTAEAATKLAVEGTAEKFKNLNRDLSIVKANGQVVLTDLSSNSRLALLGPSNEEQAPAELFDQNTQTSTEEIKVIIFQQPDGHELVLDVMPTIAESQSATYESFSPLHHPGEILKYVTTRGRSWNITAKLVSRNTDEASRNLRYINLIRSWVIPFYGQGTANNRPRQLGLPPPLLTLKAYGSTVIDPVPAVLESYNWDWPNDVDYIEAVNFDGDIVPFPVIISVSLSLKESWSPAQFSSLDIDAYRHGKLGSAFSFTARYGGPRPGLTRQAAQMSRSETTTAATTSTLETSQSTTITRREINTASTAVTTTSSSSMTSINKTSTSSSLSETKSSISQTVNKVGGG